ncbi:MAG: hypothetical protein MJ237_06790 [bacterium]|nr:hypothetical protein [bacterium]
MVSGISQDTYIYNGKVYRKHSKQDAETGYWVAMAASAVIGAMLPPFSNPFQRQMVKEHANNSLYRDAFEKSFAVSGLDKLGVKFADTFFISPQEAQLYKAGQKIVDGDIKAGLNACYIPDLKIVKLNGEKATISGFHELGHAMNHLQGKFTKFLQKCRRPGYVIAGLMGTIALIPRNKPKEADKNGMDFLTDNCGKIAFAAMLPTVAEEAIASHKGIKLAKKAGLAEPLLKNLRKFYGKALLSYLGYALITGVSVFATSKITEWFTRPTEVKDY